ncbi:MAG: hypothetical protein QM764_18945 [Chitinophagaceae bacterium]
MKRILLLTFAIAIVAFSSAQNYLDPETSGFRLLKLLYKNDTINILIKSKKHEEHIQKPVLFFCQGSLPIPLILVDDKVAFGTFPFNADSVTENYHLVIVGKPGVPVAAELSKLDKDYTFFETQPGKFPKTYLERNYADYYIKRNKEVIRYLLKQSWVTKNKLIVAGHSEGSFIAAGMASETKEVTHLIYSGGNPLGRMMTIITRDRREENDSILTAEKDFDEWKNIIEHPEDTSSVQGDPSRTTFSFSKSLLENFKKLTIPTLVSYGTGDYGSAPFNDYLRFEMIRLKKANFFFKAYIGKEHNYFSLKPDGSINYDDYNWDKVMRDWLYWIKNN